MASRDGSTVFSGTTQNCAVLYVLLMFFLYLFPKINFEASNSLGVSEVEGFASMMIFCLFLGGTYKAYRPSGLSAMLGDRS